MRRENRAPALARLDQPQVLRHVFRTLREDALASKCVSNSWSGAVGIDSWSRMQARATASSDSPSGYLVALEPIGQSITGRRRANLHMWSENKERHALLETCSWSSALLATQRRERDVAAGEAHD